MPISGKRLIVARILSHFLTFSFFLPLSSMTSRGSTIALIIKRITAEVMKIQAHIHLSDHAVINNKKACKNKVNIVCIILRKMFLFILLTGLYLKVENYLYWKNYHRVVCNQACGQL